AERVLFFVGAPGTLGREAQRTGVPQRPEVAVDAPLPRSTRVDYHRVSAGVRDRHDHAPAAGAFFATLLTLHRRARVEGRLEVVVDHGAAGRVRRGEASRGHARAAWAHPDLGRLC